LTIKSRHWQHTAIAVAASLGLWAPNAMALSLGSVAVQSALGEPLRAEVEVLNINAEEAASLKTTLASPESFKAAGLEYSEIAASIQASLQKKPDGRAYIRLSSERAINEPFVDLILEANWASGRILRDYTLLFDPPNLRSTAASAPTPAQLPAQVQVPPPVSQANAVRSAPTASATSDTTRPARPRKSAAATPTVSNEQVLVKAGDTAGRIAAASRQDKVSLDQMLVALLRANPQAFVGNNVNRLKAGSVINIPTAEQAVATPAAEAAQMVVAQSRDFNEFRRKLATSAPDTTLAVADRTASGSIQARVEDKKPVASAPDKLTLSKGAVKESSAQDQIANERRAKDAAARAAELSKNISDLGKLGAASSAAAGLPVPAGSATSTASSPAATHRGATASLPAPGASMAVKRPPAAPAPAPSAGPFEEMLDNPLVPAGAAGLIALLAFFGIYRTRQRKKALQIDEFSLDSHSRPDAFFEVSGGQNIKPQKSAAAGTTVVATPGQPAGAEHADPVAQAAVYLANGRDLQAEEILKDALRASPQRIAIHHKLLELFARRNDTRSFEKTAREAFKLTHGTGADWERIRELGLSIDADNPCYLPGWQPDESEDAPSVSSTPLQMPDHSAAAATGPLVTPQASGSVDLDLDFSLDEEPADSLREAAASAAPTTPGKLQPAPVEIQPAAPVPNHDLLEFDLGSLTLDLDDSAEPEADRTHDIAEDPLATKLALAEEFSAIGDVNGAHTLIEEVIAEASGDMKLKAQRALGKLPTP
jgi:pilus assembly protein FimV